MARRKTLEERMQLIEDKYTRRFEKIYEKYKNRTWGELQEQMDIMKDQIAREVEDASRRYNLDGQDGVGNERPVANNISNGGDGVQ